MQDSKLKTLAIVGSYPPRKCGIATFSQDLHDAMVRGTDIRALVLAMDDTEDGYDYPSEVRFELQPNAFKDYELATDYLNINQIDVVSVQHEFGLFGARGGENIVALVRDTRMPVITTLHTVLSHPTWEQSAVMKGLLQHSDRLVVMSQRARQILCETYGAPNAKIAVIPHGIPDMPFVDPSFHKDRFGLAGKRVLMTFGLLGPGKGLETAIQALPAIIAQRPEVVYVIVGSLHPHEERRHGRSYLLNLQRLAQRLGVSEHVIFHTRYVSVEELCAYLGAADIHITPYPNAEQICSGTLTYAMGAGKAAVSTPFQYAQEMLAEGRGKLFPFNDSKALAQTVLELLKNPVETDAMRKAAYTFCRPMVWKEVGAAYRALAEEVLVQRRESPRRMITPTVSSRRAVSLPEIQIRHLAAMTDDTGLLQHAIHALPDRRHGYCTDDNARALVTAMMYWDLTEDEEILTLARRYMSFVLHAYDAENRGFRNFLTYDRRWMESSGCGDDAFGRALLALGTVVALAPAEYLRAPAARLFGEALAGAEVLTSPRGWAHTVLGISAYLRRFAGDAFARRLRDSLVRRLYGLFTSQATPEWPWCEPVITYDNAVIPHALIVAGAGVSDAVTQRGLDALEWLLQVQTGAHGRLMLVGNQGWLPRGGVAAKFDQQPIDAMALVNACAAALLVTGDERWLARTQTCFDWFLGANCIQAELYDPVSGGCRDGLGVNGSNDNQGAESTLAWLTSLMTMHQLQRQRSLGSIPTLEDEPVLENAGEQK